VAAAASRRLAASFRAPPAPTFANRSAVNWRLKLNPAELLLLTSSMASSSTVVVPSGFWKVVVVKSVRFTDPFTLTDGSKAPQSAQRLAPAAEADASADVILGLCSNAVLIAWSSGSVCCATRSAGVRAIHPRAKASLNIGPLMFRRRLRQPSGPPRHGRHG